MTTSLRLVTTVAEELHHSLLVTTDPGQVRAAQRLRNRVFAGELGAVLDSPEAGHDVDRFDAFCEHLVVCHHRGEVVGTYRLLTPGRAERAGGLYADAEFDLTASRRCGRGSWRSGARASTPTTAPAG